MKKILTTVVMLCLLCAMLLPVGAFASHEAWPTLSEDLCKEIASKYAIQYHQDAAAVERILVCCVGEYDGMYLCGIGDYLESRWTSRYVRQYDHWRLYNSA